MRPDGRPLRGIGYDAGVLYERDFDSRPLLDEHEVRRDLLAIRYELGCDAILVMSSRPRRLETVARLAAAEGLEVWLQPRPFDEPRSRLRDAVAETAAMAEALRRDGARVGVVVGCELTLSVPGFLPGGTFWLRASLLPITFPLLPLANRRLRALLRDLVPVVRERFSGPVSYGAGEWERPDWGIFDVVGLDAYRDASNSWRFASDLRRTVERHRARGRPVFVFEFGSCAYSGASAKASRATGVLRSRRGELRVVSGLDRDEGEQAAYLGELLDEFDAAGVEATFAWGFSEPMLTRSTLDGRDLDLASYGVVAVHPDGTWTPKAAFFELARRYGGRPRRRTGELA